MLFQPVQSLKKNAYIIASSLFLTLTLNLIGGTLLQAKVAKEEEQATIYTKLASLHLPSMAKQEMEERKIAEETADHNKQIREANQKKWFNKSVTNMQIAELGDAQAFRYVYSIFSKNESPIIPANALKTTVHQDLEINCGNDKTAPQRNLLHKITDELTLTKCGAAEIRKMTDLPLTNTAELRNRQTIVKTLIQDEVLFNELDAALSKIKSSENEFLWFWREFDDATDEYFAKTGFQGLFKNLNDSEQGLEMGALWTQVGSPSFAITQPLIMSLLSTMIFRHASKNLPFLTNSKKTFFEAFKETFRDTYINPVTIAITGEAETQLLGKCKFDSSSRLLYGMVALLILGTYSFGVWASVQNAHEFETISQEMQKRLNHVGTFCQSSLSIASLLTTKQLSNISATKEIAETFSAKHKDPASAQMSSALLTETFKGNPSFFSNKGRVIYTFNQMRQLRDHFTDTMKAIGQIDAYMAIAKLYKKHANNSNAKFCFVEYVDNATTPQITLQKFWNPMINPDVVVTNDVEIGTNANNPRNVIITGPNAGGKSTVLKGVTLAIILGQTFGIAPANRMVFTPFHLINTYLNIADTSGVESLFQAEMRRVEDLLREIRSLKRNEFSYVIMDEIFTGTNPKEGMAGAYGIAKKLSTYPNNVSLVATHFMVLTDLAKDTNGLFANKKVCVNRDEFGKISYIYKLENGITDQAIALDLLAQSGFDSEILADAQHIFNRQSAQAGIRAH